MATLSAIIPDHAVHFFFVAAIDARVRGAALDRDRRADPRGQVHAGAGAGRSPGLNAAQTVAVLIAPLAGTATLALPPAVRLALLVAPET